MISILIFVNEKVDDQGGFSLSWSTEFELELVRDLTMYTEKNQN